MKTEALKDIGAAAGKVDREALEAEVRDIQLGELLTLFENNLQLPCLAAVKQVIRDDYDYPPG